MAPDPQSYSLQCRIALSLIPQLSLSTARTLLEKVGTPELFFEMPEAQLRNALGPQFKYCDSDSRRGLLDRAEKEVHFVQDNHIKVLFCADSNYPRRLRTCDDAPVCLYLLGNVDLDAMHIIGIVGTRNATTYGVEITRRLVHDLAQKLPSPLIVSGLAYGIDVAAHRTAITDEIPTLGVVAHGLDTIYPADHRDVAARMVRGVGGIVSEYPSQTRIHRSNFLSRNRIVAGLCDALIVVESDYKGGALSTARIASLYGRTVFAVPGRITDIYSRGTNRLISNDTARILTDADSLISTMEWTPIVPDAAEEPAAPYPAIPPEQQKLLDLITENPSATVNEMCASLGIPFPQMQDTLFRMEMADLIISVPGGRYAKI